MGDEKIGSYKLWTAILITFAMVGSRELNDS